MSEDKTRDILNCFAEIQRLTQEKMKREAEIAAARQKKQDMAELLPKLETHLKIQGLSDEPIGKLDLKAFFHREGIVAAPPLPVEVRKRTGENLEGKKKKEVRKGKKTVPDRTGMERWKAEQKLTFIAANADSSPSASRIAATVVSSSSWLFMRHDQDGPEERH